MLRLLQISNALPFSLPVDPNAEFQPGQIAQMNAMGNQVVCGVSDGTAPIGVIDDIKTHSFTSPSIDEVSIVSSAGVISNGKLVTPNDLKVELENPYILERSFRADIPVELISKNGVIVIPAGTELNFDQEGSGTPDSVRVVTNYTYQIANVPGDDSTQGSGRMTIWFCRMIAMTDMYETNQVYPLNANLFVSESGLLTTRMPSPDYAAVALVMAPPSNMSGGWLQFMWL